MLTLAPHLLVVDDHPSFRDLCVLRLRSLGCTCTAVGSVAAAIEALEREPFDSVLSDRVMPGQSGLDLLAYVRRRRPELPFVLMSNCLDDELRRTALEAGAQLVYDKDELLGRFREVVPDLLAHAA